MTHDGLSLIIVYRPCLKAIMMCSIITMIINLYSVMFSPVYFNKIESKALEVKKIIAQFTHTLVRESIYKQFLLTNKILSLPLQWRPIDLCHWRARLGNATNNQKACLLLF
jgi:hypothetical protein